MSMDFNDAESNTSFDIIPAGTVAPMMMTIRPGHEGHGGWETASQSSDVRYLSCEFVITEGQFAKRKFWQNMVVSGGKTDENGNSKAAAITRSTLRGILESARRVKPNDESDEAKAKRIVSGYEDFSGIEFVGKIGIEKGSNGYADKNKLLAPVPVTSKDYASGGDAVPFGKAAENVVNKAATAAGSTPAWAA